MFKVSRTTGNHLSILFGGEVNTFCIFIIVVRISYNIGRVLYER